MSNIISLDNIFVNVDHNDFNQLIRYMSKNLIEKGFVKDIFSNEVIKREKNFPTALPTVPYGVAIPHTDAEFVVDNKVSIAVLQKPITMNLMGGDANDKVEVHIVFMLALNSGNKQLNILQKIMGAFQNEESLVSIYNGKKEEIYEVLAALLEEK